MAHISEILINQELINYTRRAASNEMVLSQFFPEQKKGTLDFKMFKGAYNAPVSAEVHAFDSETQLADYDDYSLDTAKLLLIKRQFHISEELIIRLDETSSEPVKEEIKRELYNHVDMLINSIKVRIERFCAEVIQTGKIKIDENGVKMTIDYHMPANHLVTADWTTEDADPIADIQKWCDTVEETSGVRPTRALTRNAKMREFLNHPKVRKQVLGTEADRLLSLQEYNAFAQSMGLPVIGTYEGYYRQQLPSGKKVKKKYLEDKSFILMPPDKLGDTFYGPTAEEIKIRNDPSVQVRSSDKITTITYTQPDSPAQWIKAVATGLVSFPYADEVLCATIE